jgi:hypothetical protein
MQVGMRIFVGETDMFAPARIGQTHWSATADFEALCDASQVEPLSR